MDENATDFGEKLEKNPEYWNKSIDKSSTISCSLISENHTEHVDGFVDLVFDNLPNNELLYMGSGDIDTEHGVCLYNPRQMHPKPISYSSPERLIKNTKNYNEISIYRKNKKMKNFFGKIQPSYILVYDKNKEEYSNSSIGKQALEYAAYFNVPIIYLNEKKYKKIIEAKTEKYKNGDIDNFNIKDIKAIMELNTMTEEESLELIMKYIDKSTLSEEKFNNMINEIKEYLTNYYIDSSKNINKAINLLEKHAIKFFF